MHSCTLADVGEVDGRSTALGNAFLGNDAAFNVRAWRTDDLLISSAGVTSNDGLYTYMVSVACPPTHLLPHLPSCSDTLGGDANDSELA